MIVETRQVLSRVPWSARGLPFGSVAKRAASGLAVPVGLAATYYVGCLLGFALRFPSSGISFLWPPNAILLAGLLLVAPRGWPALLGSAFLAHGLAHAQDGIPVTAWPIQFCANASQALLGAWVVRHFGTVEISESFRDALVFVLGACILAPAIASVPSSYVYVSLGWAHDLLTAWRARAVSNAMATLAVVPSLLFLWRVAVRRPVVRGHRVVELLALLVGLVATLAAARFFERTGLLGLAVNLYAITPFLIWAAVRFGGHGLSMALLTTLLFISKTATEMIPLTSAMPADVIVGAQLLLTATAVPLMLLAGLLEQHRAEHRTLVDVEQQNRAILRALPDQMVLHTESGRILPPHPGAIDGLSTESSEAQLSVPLRVATEMVQPSPSARRDQTRVTEHTQLVDGSARRYEARCVAVDDRRMLTIIRDITDRWRSEQALLEAQHRYALATGTGVIGVWDYDVAARQMHVEGTLKAALGYGDDEIGDTVSDWQSLIFASDRDDTLARVSAAVSGEEPSLETECRLVHKDGSLRWISMKGAVTHLIDGKPARIVGTYADVTERRESARALRDANETLTRLGRITAMGELTASIAHELNQPLSAITANVVASLRMLESTPPAALREALNDVLRDSRLASQIVERTQRLFAKRPADHVPLNLNRVASEVAKIAAARLKELDVLVRLELGRDIPDVHADMIQMQQLLFNLIVNAADAVHDMPSERRLIRVSTRRSHRYVFVSVRDRGVGLGQTDIARLFEPFYTTKTTGTGMGLAISRSIVQSHAGSLWAVANVDGGSTFSFKIPIPMSRRADMQA